MSEEKETCKTCKYRSSPVGRTETYECRLNPPTALESGMRWPQVHKNDWCGQFKKKE